MYQQVNALKNKKNYHTPIFLTFGFSEALEEKLLAIGTHVLIAEYDR